MKLSNILFLTLLIFVIMTFVLSNLALKNQYNSIDKSDEFWSFSKKATLSFSHVVIDGGNNVYTSLVNKPSMSSSIFFKDKQLENLVDYVVDNDTLKIKFDQSLYRDKLDRDIRRKSKLIIIYNKLKSLRMDNSLLSLKLKTEKKVNISASGNSDLIINAERTSLDTLSFSVSGGSLVSFENDSDFPRVELLEARISDSSKVDFKNIISQNTKLWVNDNSNITLGTGILNSIEFKPEN